MTRRKTFDPVGVPLEFWRRDDVRLALARREVGRLFGIYLSAFPDCTQTQLALITEHDRSDISNFVRGTRSSRVGDIDVLGRIADGLVMPDEARILIGLAPAEITLSSIRSGPAQQNPAVGTSADVYQSPAERARLAFPARFDEAHVGENVVLARDLPKTRGDARDLQGPKLDRRTPADELCRQLAAWTANRSNQSIESIIAAVSEEIAASAQTDRDIGFGMRQTVSRADVAQALADYYVTTGPSPFRPYEIALAGGILSLSVVTRPEWTNLAIPLSTAAEHAVLARTNADQTPLDCLLTSAAISRIAEIRVMGTRVADTVLYRLNSVVLTADLLRADFGTTTFVEYALTMDLMERELIGTLRKSPAEPLSLPIRERLLPDLESVCRFNNRLCVGGTVALFAAARRAGHRRQYDDVALLVQQRSNGVLNAVGQLATIPKAFHQPMNDLTGDARLSATLLREMEEELFGRDEVDNVQPGPQRRADPMHPTRLSEPLRWLDERRGTGVWRMECVGLGLNLVSGNYEFACLIYIEDPQWWDLFGGLIEANWESDGLRTYSSTDGDLLDELMADSTWSNEGLFAFAEGLRRLRELTGTVNREAKA